MARFKYRVLAPAIRCIAVLEQTFGCPPRNFASSVHPTATRYETANRFDKCFIAGTEFHRLEWGGAFSEIYPKYIKHPYASNGTSDHELTYDPHFLPNSV